MTSAPTTTTRGTATIPEPQHLTSTSNQPHPIRSMRKDKLTSPNRSYYQCLGLTIMGNLKWQVISLIYL